MFRTVLLSIALTLATGPTASLVCRTWCVPSTAKEQCHDVGFGLLAKVREVCSDSPLPMTAVITENARGDFSLQKADHAVPVGVHRIVDLRRHAIAVREYDSSTSIGLGPLGPPLRI